MTFPCLIAMSVDENAVGDTSDFKIIWGCAPFHSCPVMLNASPTILLYVLTNFCLILINTQPNDPNILPIALNLMSFHYLLIMCHRSLTRSTPTRPEVNEHHLSNFMFKRCITFFKHQAKALYFLEITWGNLLFLNGDGFGFGGNGFRLGLFFGLGFLRLLLGVFSFDILQLLLQCIQLVF